MHVYAYSITHTSYYPVQCIVQEVMESVVSDSFCITISGWGLVVRNASPNVVYSMISACRCRQMRPFVSSSPRIVLYGGLPLKSGHFLRRSGSCLWAISFGVPARAAISLHPRLSVHVSLQPTFPGCCLSTNVLISTLLLPHLPCQLQAGRFLHIHAIACVVVCC